jgi:branched-chain amino acid transport system ATP-binding protein
MTGSGASLLEVVDVQLRYGSTVAVRGVSLTVQPGQVVALVGASGAGKTTTLKAISGALAPAAGSIRFKGRELKASPHAALTAGIAHSPEGRQVFPLMSVEENLLVGAHIVRDRRTVEARRTAMFETFPILGERRSQAAGTLSGGEQQMLAMARALMSGPELLLLDEPTMGLAPIMVRAVGDEILRLKDRGMSMVLVEETADLTMRVADSMYLMDAGRIAASGPTSELLDSDVMRRLYLGEPGVVPAPDHVSKEPASP